MSKVIKDWKEVYKDIDESQLEDRTIYIYNPETETVDVMEFTQMPKELIDQAEEQLRKEYAQKKPLQKNEPEEDITAEEVTEVTIRQNYKEFTEHTQEEKNTVMEIDPYKETNNQNKTIFWGMSIALVIASIILITGIVHKFR